MVRTIWVSALAVMAAGAAAQPVTPRQHVAPPPASPVALPPASRPVLSPVPRAVPGTRPAPPAATQPSPLEMHLQAVELMRAGDYEKAGQLLDRVYRATRPQDRTRALVLNRAIVERAQKVRLMRSLKELEAFLTTFREWQDEPATNILGASVARAAEVNPKWTQSPIWQAAAREWNRRNYVLERGRKGWHRWGMKWLDEAQWKELQDRKKTHEDRLEELLARAERLSRHYASLWAEYAHFAPQSTAFTNHAHTSYTARTCPLCIAAVKASATQAELLAQMNPLAAEMEQVNAQYEAEKRVKFEPEWPETFDPIDPEVDPVNGPPLAPAEPPAPVPGF